MANNPMALQLYNKGISRNEAENSLLSFGLCASATGVACTAASWRNEDDSVGVSMGIGFFCAGVAMTITGVTMKIRSIKLVKQSVDMYNRGTGFNKTTGMDLKFGIIGNGVGVALSF
jgi:hypothetical protein